MTESIEAILFRLLQQGDVKVFNDGRKEKSGLNVRIGPHLVPSGDVLFEGKDFSDFNLRGIGFTKTIFRDIYFGGTSLHGATFEDCQLHNCSFYANNTANLAFRSCDFTTCRFVRVNWARVDVEGSTFGGESEKSPTTFTDCEFAGFSARMASWREVRVTPKASKNELIRVATIGIK